jgi:2-polyprenyl-3-methyl-5-hydroxy-6-metoxy-1,4-benzoquinol methylase
MLDAPTNTIELPAAADLEHVGCDLCGRQDALPFAEVRDYWHDMPGRFEIVQCRGCRLVYVNPRPNERSISAYYPQDYYAFITPEPLPGGGLRNRMKRFVRAHRTFSRAASFFPVLQDATRDAPIRDDIPGWIPPGAVLDVGCGAGATLDIMADMGWRTYGIEPDVNAAQRARARGHHVWCQSAGIPLTQDLQFNLILVTHTLEHVHSPKQTLGILHQLLVPGSGRIVIEVPNIDSLFTALFAGTALAFDTPRHLYLYSPDTLARYLVETGFTIERFRHRSSPQQAIKSLTLIRKLFPVAGIEDAGAFWKDPGVVAAFAPIADLATERRQGGALRVTALKLA